MIKKTEEKRSPIAENSRTIMYLFILLSGIGTVTGLGYLHKLSAEELLRNGIVTLFLLFTLCAAFAISVEKNTLLYDNKQHLKRFALTYAAGLCFVAVSGYLPYKVWPVIVLAVALSLTSNAVLGMCAYVSFLLMVALLYEAYAYVFYTNIFVGLIAITMFMDLDEEFHYMGSLVTSCIALLVGENAFYLLFENARPSLDQYVYPLVNVCVSAFFLLLLLKYYSKKIVHVYRDKYQEINDPEFVLLAQCKKQNPEAYYHAIHTAYFCDKISVRIGVNPYLAKGLGYYSKIHVFTSLAKDENARDFVTYYHFPPELKQALWELNGEAGPLKKKEVVIAYFADAVVSSIRLFYEKNKDIKLDHTRMIHLIFKKKMDSGILKSCELTIEELEIMKNLFIEENLYYDFLR